MGAIPVTAKLEKAPEGSTISTEPVTISFDFGDNLEASVNLFGNEAVYEAYLAGAKIDCQAQMRRLIKAGKDAQTITSEMAAWKPQAGRTRGPVVRKDPKVAIAELLGRLSPEERINLIKNLREQIAAA